MAYDATNQKVLYLNGNTYDIDTAIQLRNTVDGSNKYYRVFGEHNKPSGFYTGNGDATERNITFGNIGNVILIWSLISGVLRYALITPFGGIGRDKTFESNESRFYNGTLTIITSNDNLNAKNIPYYYQVL